VHPTVKLQKYMKKKMNRIEKLIVIVGSFNICSSEINKQKVSLFMEESNNLIKLILKNTVLNNSRTFFLSAHGTLTTTDQMPGHKRSFSKFKRF
jgi:hypothetical protein